MRIFVMSYVLVGLFSFVVTWFTTGWPEHISYDIWVAIAMVNFWNWSRSHILSQELMEMNKKLFEICQRDRGYM